MNNKLITSALLKNQSSLKGCNKLFCSTCGGVLYNLKHNPPSEIDHIINEYLGNVSYDEFIQLKAKWQELIQQLKPLMVNKLFSAKIESIENITIRELDFLLIRAKYRYGSSKLIDKCLQLGIHTALETQDESLIETVVIILGSDVLQHKDILSLALHHMNSNDAIHKALYNSVRTTLPEVRGYVGNGSSIEGWY